MIRTFLSKNNTLFYQAGGGVVSKSSPQGELEEVGNKLRALQYSNSIGKRHQMGKKLRDVKCIEI